MREERKKGRKERRRKGKEERKGIYIEKGTCFKVRQSACVFQLCNLLFV